MRRFLHVLLALAASALLVSGNGGLRAVHLVAEAGHAHGAPADDGHHGDCGHHHAHCDAAHDVDPDHDRAPEPDGADRVPHDELTCSTCELLLALGTLLPAEIPAPTFHALVAVTDEGAPEARPAPAPMRAIAARPPPSC